MRPIRLVLVFGFLLVRVRVDRAVVVSVRMLVPDRLRIVCRPRSNAGSVDAAVISTYEQAKRHAERSRKRRQDPLVGGLAGFEALDRARENAGCCGQLVDAVAACDAKAHDARRQWFDRPDSVVPVPQLRTRRLRRFRHHRVALRQ